MPISNSDHKDIIQVVWRNISYHMKRRRKYVCTSKKISYRCVSQLEKQYSRSVPKKFPGPFATLCQNTILFLLSFSPPSFNQAYLIGLVSNKVILIVELQSVFNPIKSRLFKLLSTPWGFGLTPSPWYLGSKALKIPKLLKKFSYHTDYIFETKRDNTRAKKNFF